MTIDLEGMRAAAIAGHNALVEMHSAFVRGGVYDGPKGAAIKSALAARRQIQAALEASGAELCPICNGPFRGDDLCATDITEGTCHAACLEGSPVVDLGTGEETDGEADTYRYDSLAQARSLIQETTNG